MLAEILLVLAGHQSSLFLEDNSLHPDFAALLHPGEKQCFESLGLIACRYRTIKSSCRRLSQTPSRYVCAMCAKLNEILKNEYESLVVSTEAKILTKDDAFVGQGSFVPLSSIRATFSEWDSPLAALEVLLRQVEQTRHWPPGQLIDLLLEKSNTGVHRVSKIMSQLAQAVQRTWKTQLQMFLVHGSIATIDPLLTSDFAFLPGAVPSCIPYSTKSSIIYIGRAIATLKSSKWHKQIPSSLSIEHTRLLESVMPQDRHTFDDAIATVRTDISEWLWSNVLTVKDVEDTVDFLANYFLMQNGEFSVALLREIERLKVSRLTGRSGTAMVIREQDLHHALLRASVGTSAQVDPLLSNLKFELPAGSVRPLLPTPVEDGVSTSSFAKDTRFDDILLGSTLKVTYEMKWPMELFLQPQDLKEYAELFSFLSSLRYVHMRIHTCWTSLSNSQRARRRWTGLDEGGTQDSKARVGLLRCGWGIVRLLGWFTDVLLGYMMNDVVESEFRTLKKQLKANNFPNRPSSLAIHNSTVSNVLRTSPSQIGASVPASSSLDSVDSTKFHQLDFTTMRNFHTAYLRRLKAGCLCTQPTIMSTIREIFDVCELFMGQVERWGGDVLPALLFEGSISGDEGDAIGSLVRERWQVLERVDKTTRELLDKLYSQLSTTTSQLFGGIDGVGPIGSADNGNASAGTGKRTAADEMETRRHVERLLVQFDFNRSFSKPRKG